MEKLFRRIKRNGGKEAKKNGIDDVKIYRRINYNPK